MATRKARRYGGNDGVRREVITKTDTYCGWLADQSRKQVGQDQCKCRRSWDNGKGRCGQSSRCKCRRSWDNGEARCGQSRKQVVDVRRSWDYGKARCGQSRKQVVNVRRSWDNGKARCGQKKLGWEMATGRAWEWVKQVGANVEVLGIIVRQDVVKT